MPNLHQRGRQWLRGTLLTATAIAAFPLAAYAKDLPPTPEGAQKLAAVLATYLGKAAASAAAPITVVPEGSHYALAIDLAGLAAPFKESGFSIDPAILKYQLTEQEGGTWHVVGDAFPPISLRAKELAESFDIVGYKFDGIFDPALATFKNSQTGFDSQKVEAHGPQIDETINLGALKVTQSATPVGPGAVSLVAHEELADISMSVLPKSSGDPSAPDAKPQTPITVQVPAAVAEIGLDGAPLRKGLDLWAFAVAHPTRAELAANEPAFKDLLRGVLPASLKLAEKVEMRSLTVKAPQGPFAIANAKFAIAGAWLPGPKDSVEYRFSMDGMSLPAGLVPPPMQALAPTAFDFDIKGSGFDLGAGAEEAINDMHLAGDGPVISDADRAQVMAKLKGAGPIVVELLPSHVVAPQIDLTLEGQARIEGARPSGSLKVHARNFDKTVEALKALGPLASPQLLGGLAMAKTLAKTESDGALTWVAEYGADGSIKVNGLPLGKAP
jgi:hypothetical protein